MSEASSCLRQQHWDRVYETKRADEVSWFQHEPSPSLAMIAASGIGRDDPIIDVGGGASVLVDRLLDAGYTNVTVLDVSEAGIDVARARLGGRRDRVAWLVQDIVAWQPPQAAFTLWHDRAVLHFLVEEADREAYLRVLDRGLRKGGFAIIAPFAPTGPEKCSGLPVRRYSGAMLREMLGPGYRLVEERPQTHVTPWGSRQDFTWCLFRKDAEPQEA
jgi:ubiquinone/menaquinone biosynthesis C-methylase UbiE